MSPNIQLFATQEYAKILPQFADVALRLWSTVWESPGTLKSPNLYLKQVIVQQHMNYLETKKLLFKKALQHSNQQTFVPNYLASVKSSVLNFFLHYYTMFARLACKDISKVLELANMPHTPGIKTLLHTLSGKLQTFPMVKSKTVGFILDPTQQNSPVLFGKFLMNHFLKKSC